MKKTQANTTVPDWHGKPVTVKYLRHFRSRLYLEAQELNRTLSHIHCPEPEIDPAAATNLENALLEVIKVLDTEEQGSGEPARPLKRNHRSLAGKFYRAREHKQVQHESNLEKDFLYIADFDCRVLKISAQPLTLTYRDREGQIRSYTPDYSLQVLPSKEGIRRLIIEVKYVEELEKKADELKDRFDAMRLWCADNNAEFHIVTEEDLRGPLLDNVRAFKQFQHDRIEHQREENVGIDPEVEDIIIRTVAKNPSSPIGTILDLCVASEEERSRKERDYVQNCLWRLIAYQALHINMREELTYDTPVTIQSKSHVNGLYILKD